MLQTMKLEDIHFHDSVIHRVIENTEDDSLSFEVDYPVDWGKEIYERKIIKFTDVLNYQVNEGPFAGKPTLLDWSIVGNEDDRDIVRLETSTGYRQFSFRSSTEQCNITSHSSRPPPSLPLLRRRLSSIVGHEGIMMKRYLFLPLLLLVQGQFADHVWAQSASDRTQLRESEQIEKAFIDSKANVHFIDRLGKDVQMTRDGRCEDLKIDKAHQVVGWVHRATVEDEKGKVLEEYRAEIVVYQKGRDNKIISTEQTIWGWKFWENGKKIAFGKGPAHGGSTFVLYDLESGHAIDKCDKTDSTQCPSWASGL